MLPIERSIQTKGRMEMGKKAKREYARLRADTGQHRRIMAVMAVLGVLAFVPVGAQL